MFRTILSALIASSAPALAEGFAPITDKSTFVDRIANRSLNIGLFDLSLRVYPDGKIEGKAVGWGVTGRWDWKDGLFCRDMDWSGMDIPYNCQLVEIDGNKVRFTSDAGKGRAATMTLR